MRARADVAAAMRAGAGDITSRSIARDLSVSFASASGGGGGGGVDDDEEGDEMPPLRQAPARRPRSPPGSTRHSILDHLRRLHEAGAATGGMAGEAAGVDEYTPAKYAAAPGAKLARYGTPCDTTTAATAAAAATAAVGVEAGDDNAWEAPVVAAPSPYVKHSILRPSLGVTTPDAIAIAPAGAPIKAASLAAGSRTVAGEVHAPPRQLNMDATTSPAPLPPAAASSRHALVAAHAHDVPKRRAAPATPDDDSGAEGDDAAGARVVPGWQRLVRPVRMPESLAAALLHGDGDVSVRSSPAAHVRGGDMLASSALDVSGITRVASGATGVTAAAPSGIEVAFGRGTSYRVLAAAPPPSLPVAVTVERHGGEGVGHTPAAAPASPAARFTTPVAAPQPPPHTPVVLPAAAAAATPAPRLTAPPPPPPSHGAGAAGAAVWGGSPGRADTRGASGARVRALLTPDVEAAPFIPPSFPPPPPAPAAAAEPSLARAIQYGDVGNDDDNAREPAWGPPSMDVTPLRHEAVVVPAVAALPPPPPPVSLLPPQLPPARAPAASPPTVAAAAAAPGLPQFERVRRLLGEFRASGTLPLPPPPMPPPAATEYPLPSVSRFQAEPPVGVAAEDVDVDGGDDDGDDTLQSVQFADSYLHLADAAPPEPTLYAYVPAGGRPHAPALLPASPPSLAASLVPTLPRAGAPFTTPQSTPPRDSVGRVLPPSAGPVPAAAPAAGSAGRSRITWFGRAGGAPAAGPRTPTAGAAASSSHAAIIAAAVASPPPAPAARNLMDTFAATSPIAPPPPAAVVFADAADTLPPLYEPTPIPRGMSHPARSLPPSLPPA